MGCVACSSSATRQEAAWTRLGGGWLEEPLRKEWIKLVRADWLVRLAESGDVLLRRQDLPPEVFVGVEELKRAGPAVLNSTALGVGGEWLRVVVLSHPWLEPGHPDPHGESLCLIAEALKHYIQDSDMYINGGKPYGVLIDFTALPQAPRTEDEDTLFELALPVLDLFYSHPQTVVLKVTGFPEGYPNHAEKKYNLPEGSNTGAYTERGWCFAESAMSGLVKNSNKVLDLAQLGGDRLSTVIFCSRAGRAPPLLPTDFEAELDKKTFASKGADFDKVAKLYADAFARHVGSATELDYSGLGWDAEAARSFAQVLVHIQALQSLRLQENNFGDTGAAVLAAALKSNEALQQLDLGSNGIGPRGAAALGTVLRDNLALQSLSLWSNNIGDEGAEALAEALKCNEALRSLNLQVNYIRAEGAAALSEALKANAALESLDLAWNKVGAEGASALGEALKGNGTLRALCLESNRVGPEGASALGQGLKGNVALRSLKLFNNGIGDEGAAALGLALRDNRVLQRLDLRQNEVGRQGKAVLRGSSHLSIRS